jgi:hypothetical protein
MMRASDPIRFLLTTGCYAEVGAQGLEKMEREVPDRNTKGGS